MKFLFANGVKNGRTTMSEAETAISVRHDTHHDILDMDSGEVKRKLERIREFQAVVKQTLAKDHDYGIIPGTEKPTLLKPGAEKIAKLMNLQDDYIIVEKIEDWDKPFFFYTVKCELREISSGLLISAGLGSCNSKESRYDRRWVPEWKLSEAQKAMKATFPVEDRPYRDKSKGTFKAYCIPNEEIFSQVNTILKMAKKRALVDAALSAGRLSDLFTQDLEDIAQRVSTEEMPTDDSTKPAHDDKPTILITSPKDGKKYPVTMAGALKAFAEIKKRIGNDAYYDCLTTFQVDHANQIPFRDMPKVFDIMLEIARGQGKYE